MIAKLPSVWTDAVYRVLKLPTVSRVICVRVVSADMDVNEDAGFLIFFNRAR
jgi:hypothetical protein